MTVFSFINMHFLTLNNNARDQKWTGQIFTQFSHPPWQPRGLWRCKRSISSNLEDADLCSHDRTTAQTVHLLHLHNRCITCQEREMGFQDCWAKTGREDRVKRRKRFVNEREEGFLQRGKTKRKTKRWVLVAFAFFLSQTVSFYRELKHEKKWTKQRRLGQFRGLTRGLTRGKYHFPRLIRRNFTVH